jgi:mannose-6-phosphate isomerase class I
MAEATNSKKSKKNEPRYSGVDTQPWRVRNAAGKPVLVNAKDGEEQFNGFKAADSAAKRFTQETDEFVAAVRA